MPKAGISKNVSMQVFTQPKLYTYNSSPAWLKAQWDQEADGSPPPELMAAIDRMQLKFIHASPDDEFVRRNSPLYSGSLMLKLLLGYHSAGLSLSNHHLSIFVVAHLYNALRRLHLLEGLEWPVMERVMKLHKRALFAGAVPTMTDHMADRLSYRLDAEDKQKDTAVISKYSFKEDPNMSVLRSLLDDQCSGERVLWLLEEYTEKVSGSSTDRKKAAKQATKTIAGQQRQTALTPNKVSESL